MEGEEKSQPRYNNVVKRGFLARLRKPRQDWSELLDRRIFTNVPDEDLGDNRIETSKYNLATFFPLNLIEQFSKLSNSTSSIKSLLPVHRHPPDHPCYLSLRWKANHFPPSLPGCDRFDGQGLRGKPKVQEE